MAHYDAATYEQCHSILNRLRLTSHKKTILLKEKKKSGFLKNTFTLASGNILSQAIRISLIPIVTRLYPPESFGLFATILAIVMVISSVSHLRYNVAIQLPKDEEDADSLALLGLLLVIFFSLISFVAAVCWGKKLATLLNISDVRLVIYFIPIGIFLRGMLMIVNSWHLRVQAFKNMSASLIFGAIGDRTFTIGIGLKGLLGPFGLIIGRYTGILFTIMGMMLLKGKRHFFDIFSLNTIKKIMENSLKFREFPKYSWSELIYQATVHMPVILLGFYFNPIVVGYFALTRRVLMEPLNLVGEAISRSFFQKTSELHREGKDISEVSIRLVHFLCLIIIFPMLLFGIFAQESFVLVFGEKWKIAGFYALLLLPLFIFDFIVRPLNSFFDILIKQKEMLFFNLGFFLCSLIVFITFGKIGNALLCIAIYSSVSMIIMIFKIYWLLLRVDIKINETTRIMLPYLLKAVVFIAPVLGAKIFYENLFLISAATIISTCLYITYYLFIDNYMSKNLLTLFKSGT